MLKNVVLILSALFGTATFATEVVFTGPVAPKVIASRIFEAAAQDVRKIYFDHHDKVLQIWGPLKITLPPVPKTRRGLFLRELKKVLDGDRVLHDGYSISTKNAAIELRDDTGGSIDWQNLNFDLVPIRIAADHSTLFTDVITQIPSARRSLDSVRRIYKITGHLVVDLTALSPATREDVRERLTGYFAGVITFANLRMDVTEAAIEYTPDELVPSTSTKYVLKVRREAGWSIDECVDQNLRDFERWYDARRVRPAHVMIFLDMSSIDVTVRSAFKRLLSATLATGRLPSHRPIASGSISIANDPSCAPTLLNP